MIKVEKIEKDCLKQSLCTSIGVQEVLSTVLGRSPERLVRVPGGMLLKTYTREGPVYPQVASNSGRLVAYIVLFHSSVKTTRRKI
jgi:hypothetical protein